MTDPKALGSTTCPRCGHWFEDYQSVIDHNGGWCPTCDAPVLSHPVFHEQHDPPEA